jgi:hypothetical protein
MSKIGFLALAALFTAVLSTLSEHCTKKVILKMTAYCLTKRYKDLKKK